MKRTYMEVVKQADGQVIPKQKITCELTGEMDDGTKVWTKLDNNGNLLLNEQYFAGRMLGKYFFIHT